MVWRFLLILSLVTTPFWAMSQTADDYFHSGAQDYIFGDKKKAATEIYTGLRTFPTDTKLNAVAKLLQRKDPEDQNKSKNNQQDQQQKKDQQKQQQQQQGQKSDQQKKDEEKAQQEKAKKDQEKK